MEEEKLRAVYYARCSTEEENQKDALVRQAAEAEEAIRARGWRLVVFSGLISMWLKKLFHIKE